MHNSAFVTLEDVLDFYDKGSGKISNKDPLLKPLNLTKQDKAALIAFLESLSGDPIEIAPPELPKKGDGTCEQPPGFHGAARLRARSARP